MRERAIREELYMKQRKGSCFTIDRAGGAKVMLFLTYKKTDGKEQHYFILDGKESNRYVYWHRMMNKLESLLIDNMLKPRGGAKTCLTDPPYCVNSKRTK